VQSQGKVSRGLTVVRSSSHRGGTVNCGTMTMTSAVASRRTKVSGGVRGGFLVAHPVASAGGWASHRNEGESTKDIANRKRLGARGVDRHLLPDAGTADLEVGVGAELGIAGDGEGFANRGVRQGRANGCVGQDDRVAEGGRSDLVLAPELSGLEVGSR